MRALAPTLPLFLACFTIRCAPAPAATVSTEPRTVSDAPPTRIDDAAVSDAADDSSRDGSATDTTVPSPVQLNHPLPQSVRVRPDLSFPAHDIARIDDVPIPPHDWLTRRLPLTRAVDGVDGTIELWGIPAYRPVHWDPTDTRHFLLHGWISGADGPRGVAIVRVVRDDGVVLGQLGFEGGLADMERRPIPSEARPSFVIEVDNAIGMGSFAGTMSHVLAIDGTGPSVASAIRDTPGEPDSVSLLSSLKCWWNEGPRDANGQVTLESQCCHLMFEGPASASLVRTRYRFDGANWRSHTDRPVPFDDCP